MFMTCFKKVPYSTLSLSIHSYLISSQLLYPLSSIILPLMIPNLMQIIPPALLCPSPTFTSFPFNSYIAIPTPKSHLSFLSPTVHFSHALVLPPSLHSFNLPFPLAPLVPSLSLSPVPYSIPISFHHPLYKMLLLLLTLRPNLYPSASFQCFTSFLRFLRPLLSFHLLQR